MAGGWRLGVLGVWAGHENVLVDYKTVDDELLWVRSDGFFPVPENCDLPVKRYQLRRDKNSGKESFWPIAHQIDVALENERKKAEAGLIAGILLKIDSGEKLTDDERAALKSYGSFGLDG